MKIIFTVNTLSALNEDKSSYQQLEERIRQLCVMGYYCIRINIKQFSDIELKKAKYILRIIEDLKENFTQVPHIYVDIPFPKEKYRIHMEKKYVDCSRGDVLILKKEIINKQKTGIYIEQEFIKSVVVGSKITYADNECVMEVVEVDEEFIKVRVQNDVRIYAGKSLYGGGLKNAEFSKEAIEVMRQIHSNVLVHAILLSFCDSGDRKREFLSILKDIPKKKYFAKIESKEGITNINSICSNFDGIVVARGDLLLTCGINNFLRLQEIIARKACEKKIQLFFATGIMLSLMNSEKMSGSDIVDILHMLRFEPEGFILQSGFVVHNKVSCVKENMNLFLEKNEEIYI